MELRKLNRHSHSPSLIRSDSCENCCLLCRRLDQLVVVATSHSCHGDALVGPKDFQRVGQLGRERFSRLLPLYYVEYESGL